MSDLDEVLRRLRLGNLRTLFQHRYGATFPDDDAGREDLRELLLPVSLGPHAAVKMPNVIEVWAPWLPVSQAALLIDDVNRTPIEQRKPAGDALGARLNVTAAERERLRLWTIAPCDAAPDEIAEQRKAKRRARQREYRRRIRPRKGAKPRTEYESTSLSRQKPWITAGISRATWYRQRETSPSTDKASVVCRRTCLTSSKLNGRNGYPRAPRRRKRQRRAAIIHSADRT